MEEASPLQPGVIVTFYSYKGGTGRSMVLANIACLMGRSAAAQSQRVLMIDWDLEAPGLHRYFPQSEDSVSAERPGVIDYFTQLSQSLNDDTYNELAGPEGRHVLEARFPLDEYILADVAEGVDFVKAGRFGPEYVDRVSSFDWAAFYNKYRRVFHALREYLMSRYAWCFIDSRTGLSDVSGVCTMLMPEKLVTVFTPNRQSLDGAIDLAARAIEYRRNSDDPRPLSVFPLPSRIVTEEHKLLQAATEKYRLRFEECLRASYGLEECNLESYFKEVAVPHKGFYGFHEMVALRDDPSASDALSINRAYERFCQRLANLDSAWDSMPDGGATETPADARRSGLPRGGAFLEDAGFETAIYVSYAHLDDQPLAETGMGWVSRFREDLVHRLEQYLGRSVRIWCDTKLLGHDPFASELLEVLENAAVFLAVVSPGYLSSEWCRRELNSFVEAATKRGGVRIGNRSRVILVAKTAVPRDTLPSAFRDYLGYEFYRTTESGRPREFLLDPDPRGRSAYAARVDDLAHDLSSLLQSLRASSGATESATVYLAESSSDVREERDSLRRELLARGHRVLPEQSLPLSSEDLVRAVQREVKRARLSIHLIGSRPGLIPEGETRSIVRLQYEIALQEPGLQRIVWLPTRVEASDALHGSFIADLTHTAAGEAEILKTSLEELKSFVLERLAVQQPAEPKQWGNQPPQVYLVCESADLPAAKELRDYLFEKGIEVTLPLFSGEPAVLRGDREESLQTCDASLVYWGSATEAWVRTVMRDLRRAPAQGRSRPLPFLVYITEPASLAKDDFITHEGLILRPGTPTALDPLLVRLLGGSAT